ncbi:MAG: MFS transporter [Actinomycetota bacterium]|nr:MFS transporter [Actinomycetota bacterium]
MTERLFTKPFLLVSVANFASGMAYALFLHFSGYLADLGASDTQIGLIYGATAVASIAMRPLLGTIMDRYGRRPVILVGNILNVVFVLLYLTVSTLGPWVYAVRIGHGVAEAMLFSALFTYGTDVIPKSRRTEGIALFGVSGLLPIGMAGIVGDFVLSIAGFRELFLTAAGFAVLTLLLSLPLPERRPTLKAGESQLGFWRVVTQRDLLPIWWMIGSFSTVLTGYFVFIRRYVDDTGFGSVGLFFSTYVAVAILERIFFGWLPDRAGRMRVLYPALGALVVGFFVLAGAGSWVGVAIAGAFCGAGHGFVFPILTALLVDRAPDTDRGSAMSFFTALFDVGTLFGGPVLGAIIDSAGWGPMYVVAGTALGVAAAIFSRWDRWATRPDETNAATAARV